MAVGFKNTWKFREAAIYFDKNKKYDYGVKGTRQYRQYWEEELKKCLSSKITIDGVSIPGRYYFYLNYCPILLVEKDKKGKVGKRERKFPKFWDEDYRYFWICEIARNGVPLDGYEIDDLNEDEIYELRLKIYKELCKPIDIGLVIDRENLSGGKHVVWVKPRGVGASFKGGSNAVYNYFLIEESKTFLIAEDKAYLDDDGLWTKSMEYLDFINTNTEFAKGSEYINDRRGMHVRASFNNNKNEDGYLSDIIGVTLKNNIEGARGKRGDIMFEESGKFPKLDTAWGIARKSVEEDGIVYAQMIAFGTSGVEKSNFESLEKMFYDPDSFNCIKLRNVWDENATENSVCCYFTPAFMSVTYMDEDGNTDIEVAKLYFDKERAKKLKSTDPKLIDIEKTEKPYSPSEAFMLVSGNKFPVAEIKTWINKIETNGKLYNLGSNGWIEEVEGKTRFKPYVDARPVLEYPIKGSTDTTGCVVLYESPYRDRDGNVPPNLYVIALDPYGSETEGGGNERSLGALYVLKNVNNMSRPDDCIVASYIARPKDMQIFHKNVFLLARHYNARICYESDRGEALLTYAKTTKQTKWLMEELSLGYNQSLPKATVSRPYGMHIGSGKNSPRKNQGLTYVDEWLRRTVSINEDLEYTYGYHTILDVGLLRELSSYNGDGNFDRVSALIIAMYAMQEIAYKNFLKDSPQTKKIVTQLLNAELFQ